MKTISKILIHLCLFIVLINTTRAQTTIEGSFIWDGTERTYRLYIPASYDPSSEAPLLFNLHGYGSNNMEQEVYGDFRPIADTANFIIAHPNGTVDFTGNRSWNTFGFSTVDDVGFLSALIDTISASFNIDPERIYSTGMSNGGFMSYDLACFLSDRIAAVASVTGSMILSRFEICDPQHPMPVMQIHGTADATVPYNGNQFFAPIDTLVNYWVNFNNCNPVPEIIEVPDIDPDDGCTAEQHIYSGGENGSSVEFFKVLGGGHSWPGAPFNINITNMDFSASVEIWRFVSQFTLDGLLTSTRDRLAQSQEFKAFPNPSAGPVTISFDDELPKTIIVMNNLGQVIEQQNSTGKNLQINLNQKGIHLITVIQQSGVTATKKVVVR
jgi:polyhydroxybutyrate depolymerase